MNVAREGRTPRQLRPVVHTSLRMPLHRQHKMSGIGSFESFDDSVSSGARHHSQPFTHCIR